MSASVCGIGRALAQAAARFKGSRWGLTGGEQKRNIRAAQQHAPAHFRNEMTRNWFGAQTGMPVMTAPLATLAFLVTLWVVNLVLADLLSDGLGKVIAALKGHSPLAAAPAIR